LVGISSGALPALARAAPSRLAVVNGLRGVAILAIAYHHTVAPTWSPLAGGAVRVGRYLVSPHTVLSNGWLGVNLFFVLSGFVIGLPYAVGDRSMGSRADVLSYYRRRARRLLPLYYFFLLVAMFIGTPSDLATRSFFDDVVRMVTFSFVFHEATYFPRFNLALWSLGIEFWFSVLFPVLVVASVRFGVWRMATGVFVVSLLVRLYGAATRAGPPYALDFVEDGVVGRLDDFVTGMVVAHLHARRLVPGRAISVAALLGGAAALFLCAAAWDNVLLSRLPFITSAFLHNLTQVAFAATLIGLLGNPPRAIRGLFTFRALQLMGMLCYSFYLWHVAGHTLNPRQESLPEYLILAFLLSAATYRYVEFPHKTVRELFLEYPEG
jgi:peptidoglycan/LPS O-acetylase OafA/YrhL